VRNFFDFKLCGALESGGAIYYAGDSLDFWANLYLSVTAKDANLSQGRELLFHRRLGWVMLLLRLGR
jgi:hypothetical protein